MSKYLVLIYEDEASYATADAETLNGVLADHMAFIADNKDAVLSGEPLMPTTTATSIREGVVTDGAFAETKEALGGYYLIEAPDIDAALAVAKQVPARFGGVEVRPVMVFEQP
ncbi:hypothetical protein KGQ20_27375 [Catenulispora sp. NF23]|uniref:YCII-related domain-containing protein n=1 Tax=Catenulispora pinistramenti TaxID=2705254 RepID=A0ABS5KNB6_9ACTN|nr:YciI family protein [Catenulispora pinistramenti]MBS2536488.1 hypothetical protein [Catenulispora pinistramenti]MBS2547552.1 hypothetical protein [Catenulispora pinistramenti]